VVASAPLTGAAILIGRGADCSVVLPSTAVSRKHASVRRQPDGRALIKDEGSANGVKVNGTYIDGPTLIDERSRIEISEFTLQLEAAQAAIEERAALAEVVEVVGSEGRFVLDSRTSERSLFCHVARARGLHCLERDFFLDDPPVPAALTSAWDRALAAARRRGWAVVIGHPYASTVEALRYVLGRREVQVVRLSRLLNRPAAHLTGQDAGI
jgi:hypothetical protein